MECPYQPSASALGETPRPDAATWPAAGATSCLEDSQGGGGGKRRRGRVKKKKTGVGKEKRRRLDRWFRQYFEAGSHHPQAYAGTGPVLREEPPKERKDKEAWLASQTTHQIHRPAPKRFPRRPFVVHSLDEMWQLDLSDMQWYKRENEGYAWILFAIDVFSRFVWTRPLKRKTGENTAAALADIFREVTEDPQSRHTLPRVIYVDRGSEFYNKNVKDLLASTPIPATLRSSHDETKAAVVERVQRTIKARLWKYLYQNGTSRWVDALPAIVDSYNHAYHTTLRRSPASITRDDEEDVWKTVHGARDAALEGEPRSPSTWATWCASAARPGCSVRATCPSGRKSGFASAPETAGHRPTTVWKTSRARTWKDRFTSRSCRRWRPRNKRRGRSASKRY